MQGKKSDLATAICRKIGLTDEEIKVWLDRAANIYLPDTTGVIEQFEGFFDIPDAYITEWDDKGMPVMPKSCEGKPRDDRPILKQADVVMLMKLLPEELSLEVQRMNYDYYEKRTLHRSSLSPSVHAQVGVQLGLDTRAYQYLERSSYVDLDNNQRNLREGLHAASTGGTWQAIVMGYCGMHLDKDDKLAFNPKLPKQWKKVRFRINWRGKDKLVTIEGDRVVLSDLE
jgi:kojibiose phosphorylase